MIYITIYRNQTGYQEFTCMGHAGYANAGQDIVCAAVSVLVINTINSIECFTTDKIRTAHDEESGLIDLEFVGTISKDSALLMDSMILGLQGIQKEYGKKFLRLDFKEV